MNILNKNRDSRGRFIKGHSSSKETQFKKGHTPWSKENPEYMQGENHWNWNGEIVKTKEYRNKVSREWRKKKGKKYIQSMNNKRRDLTIDLSVETIQNVYEENIKKYGTLTCYLCLNPILFSKDHLEHKTPLSRGGTNGIHNLEVACMKCNLSKNNKTEKEYRRFLNVQETKKQ